jgi:MDMPI C-terminal domain
VKMENWPGDFSGDAEIPHVTMPAEALLRLAYGRLDPDHTPSSVSGDAGVLDKLRAIFPGF